jgi:putative spermidine/putrescine transport system substrate-binding protein
MVWEAGHLNGSIFLAVMKGTPNLETALKFIKFAAAPEREAEFSRLAPYGPLNRKALPLLGDDLRPFLPSSYLESTVSQDDPLYVQFWLDNMDNLNERFAAWQARK